MYCVGIIEQNFSDSEYLENLICFWQEESSNTKIIRTDEHSFEKQLLDFDVILIFVDSLDRAIPATCSLLLLIRNKTNALIWVWQKRTDAINRIIYLQLGADGNLNAEHTSKEIQLLIENALKRKHSDLNESNNKIINQCITNEKIRLNNTNFHIQICDKEIGFTRKEFGLISLLQSKVGETFTYENIYQEVWQKPYKDQKTKIANVIFHIRNKMEQSQVDSKIIQTVYGVGYYLDL